MERRTVIQWTETARQQLAAATKKVRQGLLKKADSLKTCADPKKAHKPLVGPLQGYYRITYSRYRAIYSVEEEELASGDVLVYVRIRFLAVGIRKERDRKDIYEIAEKMVQLGLVDVPDRKGDDDSKPQST